MKLREINLESISELPFDTKDIYRLLSRTAIWMSWWIHNPIVYKDTILAFKVQWYIHKWWVYITLSYDDTFRIYLTKQDKKSIVKDIKWVYIDELLHTIDSYVEKDEKHYWKQSVASQALMYS